MEWTTEKPLFECHFVSATLLGTFWAHDMWEIKKVNWGDGDYLALLTGNGLEWGALDDLTADKYLILPKHL